MRKSFAFIVAFLVAANASALPIISATSGTIATGNTLTVSGSGLPIKSRTKLLLWADAQDGLIAAHSTLSNGTGLTAEFMTVDSSSAKRWGNYSFRSNTTTGRVATLKPAAMIVTYSTRIMISWWEKSTISAYLPNNWKIGVRWWVGSAGSPNYPSHYFASLAAGSASASDIRKNIELPTSSTGLGSGYGFPTSTWRRIMGLYQMNSSIGSSDGVLMIYKDGTLVRTDTTLKFNDASTSPAGRTVGAFANVPYFQHVMASGSWLAGEYWWLADMALDDSWGRYEIGNASTYAACTHLELQPYTASSANNATLNIRKGTLTGSTWLYACDNDNNCSSIGFPLTSGGLPAPTIVSLSPSNGPAAGGTTVAMVATGLVATPQVTVNGVDATGETFTDSTHMTFVSPAGVSGTLNNVVVINPDSQSGTFSWFTYNPAEVTINPATEVLPWK